jgi:Arc/MetJ-type ribon-helix-helix transcriptional regulator
MVDKNILSFEASQIMADKIQKIKETGGYVSKSEAIRDIVRKGLEVKQ